MSSQNWNEVVRLFNKTLKSIYNQTNPGFRIIVACHDKPVIEAEIDNRLEIIQVSFPTPRNRQEQMKDKYYKKMYIMKRVRDLGGGHVMFVDADDLVSNKISEFVNNNPNSPGWFFYDGYVYDYKVKRIKAIKEFYKVCGTSAILKYESSDLPSDINFSGLEEYPEKQYIFEYSHVVMKDIYENFKN